MNKLQCISFDINFSSERDFSRLAANAFIRIQTLVPNSISCGRTAATSLMNSTMGRAYTITIDIIAKLILEWQKPRIAAIAMHIWSFAPVDTTLRLVIL